MAAYEAVGELSEDGDAIADGHPRARRTPSSSRRPRITDVSLTFGLDALPFPEGRPLRILTHCNTGPLACGQFGTALGVVQAAHHAGRPLHVWVDETRPYLQGARLTTWELAQAGVPHTLIPDVAAGHLMARGEVDVGHRRRGPDRRQRRYREQGRDVHAGRARGPPRRPVLRRGADQHGRSRHAGRRGDPDRGALRQRGAACSGASASPRPTPTCATRRSTSRRPT